MNAPLSGLRVLDLTQVVMGPVATQILAEMGADVIKIEPPAGDTSRHIPPMRNAGMGYIFLHANRGKRSVVLDLKRQEGLGALLKLVESADVLICNVRPDAMARLGLTYERLAMAKPDIIYVNLVGFGAEGPYSGDPAYEDLIQSLTAVPSLLVRGGAEAPMFVPLAFNDRSCGAYCVNFVLAALLTRAKTGLGDHIVLPMFETMARAVLADHMAGRTFDPPEGPMGYQRILTDLRRPYPTSDGYVSMVLYTDNHWRAFLKVVGKESWMETDPRLKNITRRAAHTAEIYKPIVEIMRGRSSVDWISVLREADIPIAPVHTLESLIEDEHLVARRLVSYSDHPTEGRIALLSNLVKTNGNTSLELRPAPNLGEHTEEVLRESGLDLCQIAALIPSVDNVG